VQSLKRINNETYITNLFKNLAVQKRTAITLILKNIHYEACLAFNVRKGYNPSVILTNSHVELKTGEKVIIYLSDMEMAVLFKTVATSPCIDNSFLCCVPEAFPAV